MIIASLLTSVILVPSGRAALQQTWKTFEETSPYNRNTWYVDPTDMSDEQFQWIMVNFHELVDMKVVSKGSEVELAKLEEDFSLLDKEGDELFSYLWGKNDAEPDKDLERRTLTELLDKTKTDGALIMWKGEVIYEKYFGEQTVDSRHRLFSVTKSFLGVIVQMLIDDGHLKDDALVTEIIPSMKKTGLEGATVRHVMDMTTEFQWVEGSSGCDLNEMHDKINEAISMGGEYPLVEGCEHFQYDYVSGTFHPPVSFWNEYYNVNERPGPRNMREFHTLIQPNGMEHGKKFTYRTVNTDILAWIVDTVLEDTPESEYKSSLQYFEKKIWSKLGMSSDAFINMDDAQVPHWGGGMSATLRDCARFGEMLLEGGTNKLGDVVVPASIINDLAAPTPGWEKYTSDATGFYRSQFWRYPGDMDEKQTILLSQGINGQYIYIYPWLDLVVVKHSHDVNYRSQIHEIQWALQEIGYKLQENPAPLPTLKPTVPTCHSHSYSSKSYYSKKESKHSKKNSKKSYSSDSKSSKCHTPYSPSTSASIKNDPTHSPDHNNDNPYKNYAGDEMQTGGATDIINDERVRRKHKRRRFPNGSEVNQEIRSADKINNDSYVSDGNTNRRRRRFPDGAN